MGGQDAGPGQDISPREVSALLNAAVESLVPVLLPNGRSAGGFWCVGSVEGESGDSLKVRLSGAKRGGWADYSMDASEERAKGDMLKLVKLTIGNGSMGEAMRWAKGWLGMGQGLSPDALDRMKRRAAAAKDRSEREQAGAHERKRRNAEGLWGYAAPLPGTPAMKYLEARGIDFARLGRVPRALRFRGDVGHAETGRKLPAMLGAFIGLDGTHRGTHATYLTRGRDGGWSKIGPVDVADEKTGEVRAVKCAKKIFAPTYWGSAIPLNKGASREPLARIPAGTPVYVSEGIEDGLTVAMADPARRVLAAGTLGNIGALALPPQAGDLIIIGQRDDPGSKAEASLEKQLLLQQQAAVADGSGRRVLILWPAPGFKDVNDELRGVRM